MKKLVSLCLALMLLLLCGCTETDDTPAMTKPWPGRKPIDLSQQPIEQPGEASYIEAAQLTDEEQSLLNLIDFDGSQYALFDFSIPRLDHRLFFRTYVLQDDAWQITAAEQTNESRSLSYDEPGRLLLDVRDLSRQLTIAIQRADGTGYIGSSYDSESSVSDDLCFIFTLPEKTEILYGQEIPLVLQVVPADNDVSITDIHAIFDRFSDPDAFSVHAQDFEQVYATTITFIQSE